MDKIAVRDLEAMLLDPTVSEKDLRPYVEVDEFESRAFAPNVRINPETMRESPEEAALILG